MRLLNTRSLVLESFDGRPVPPYAILSHTWEDDEVRFEDVFLGKSVSVMTTDKQGYTKIKYSCDQAQRDGLDYIWIDCCCIDKSSSAELSEAINSMFSWYEKSRRCYVYLFDLNRPNYLPITFEESRWFRRGWTLQELVAPVHVEFFDYQWTRLGDKGTRPHRNMFSDPEDEFGGFEAIFNLDFAQPQDYEGNLAYRIESVTRIPIEVLTLKQRPINRLLSRFPAAQRLSWAAYRQTTKIEDRAYSLLGLFDVNMPLLYGEGKEAFIRLQQEVMNRYHDQTLLAFTRQKHIHWQLHGPLADDPDVFAHSNIIRVPKSQRKLPKALEEPFSYSWRHIDLQVYLCLSLGQDQTYALAILDCGYSDEPLSRPALLLRRLDGPGYLYRRIEHSTLCRISPRHLLNSKLIELNLPWLSGSFEGNVVEFDIKSAFLTSIKLMIGSSFTLDYGQLNAITPPTQISVGPEYTPHFVWPRPTETGTTSSQTDDDQLTHTSESLWLSATSDYDLDRVELKSVRDSMGADLLVGGVMRIERPPKDVATSAQDGEDGEEIPESYLVVWGLKQPNMPSSHDLHVGHGDVDPESAWCYVVALEDVLEPSLAPLADDLLKLDLAGILARTRASPQLNANDLKDSWTVTRSRPGSAAEVTAQICCIDFFGQETLQVRVESSHAG